MSVNLRSLFIITQIDRLLYLRDRFISTRYLLVKLVKRGGAVVYHQLQSSAGDKR